MTTQNPFWLTPKMAGFLFIALMSGCSTKPDPVYYSIGYNGGWWSSSEFSLLIAWRRYVSSDSGDVHRYNGIKSVGLSVRCLKDN